MVKIKVEFNNITHTNVEFVHTVRYKVDNFDVCFEAFSHYSGTLGIALL